MPCTPIASNDAVRDEGGRLGGLPPRSLQRPRPRAEAAGVPGREAHVGPLMTQTDPLLHHRLPRRPQVPDADLPHPPAQLAGHWICNTERLNDCVKQTRV
jgi:hypothetical protein